MLTPPVTRGFGEGTRSKRRGVLHGTPRDSPTGCEGHLRPPARPERHAAQFPSQGGVGERCAPPQILRLSAYGPHANVSPSIPASLSDRARARYSGRREGVRSAECARPSRCPENAMFALRRRRGHLYSSHPSPRLTLVSSSARRARRRLERSRPSSTLRGASQRAPNFDTCRARVSRARGSRV